MTRAVRGTWRHPGAVLGLIFVWLAATAWMRPLMLPDEGRYVGVAWEMLRSGDWLTPTLDGLPYFHKPPLFYWITAASMGLFGVSDWAARAAPLLGACLGAFALYAFTRRWSGPRAAGFALLALLMQPMFYLGAQFANLDMLVAGCITATVLLLAHCALCVERGLPCRRALLGAYAMAALGVLAKGLIGAVIPALVMLAWQLPRRRWRSLPALVSGPGVLVFLLLTLPWFAAMQWRFDGFLDYFFVVQQFKRYAAGGFNNVHPFWFYPAVLLLLSLPWLPWLHRPFTRGYLRDPERGPLRGLMLAWIVVVLLFFSLPKSKLVGYMLPVVPPLASLMADSLLSLGWPTPRAMRRWWASGAIAMAGSVAALAVFSIRPPHSTRELALTLAAHRLPHEPVFMLNSYYFDLGFYARLHDAVAVVDDWSGDDARSRDSWRKELVDASRFAAATGKPVLVSAASLPEALCGARVSWAVGAADATAAYPFLAQAQAVMTRRNATLWRIDTALPAAATALGCAERPSDDSEDRSKPPGPLAAAPAEGRSGPRSTEAGARRWLR